jgi:undecaprenyl-diphosphatase
MPPSLLQILILGIIQGAAELLPVSSSAHVIVVEKLMHLDPTSPEMTFILVMLHTGTMAAVIVYFWNSWVKAFGPTAPKRGQAVAEIIVATIATGILGEGLNFGIKKLLSHTGHVGEVEELFGNLYLIAGSLAAVGALILVAGAREARSPAKGTLDSRKSVLLGFIQGLALPFRGFSRSGSTISAGLLLGVERRAAEEFSFALAVVLTPVVVVLELHRLLKMHPSGIALRGALLPGLVGMVFAFFAGLLALKWLSSWLEKGRWGFFGMYCLAAAAGVAILALSGV